LRLRTFIAANMAEAIDEVRREMGSDAIIVSNFVNDSGQTEVTAAVETSLAARNAPAPHDSEPALSTVPDLEAALEKRLRDKLRRAPGLVVETNVPLAHSGIQFDRDQLAKALDRQFIPRDLRDALVDAAIAFDDDDAVMALSHALDLRLNFEPLPLAPRAPVMLVGMPGSGKTVTLAKLAANAIMDGKTPDLITTDTQRAGAAAQGQAYSQLLDQTLHMADSIDTLSLLLEENAASGNHLPDLTQRPCFIDTASVNPFDRVEWAALKRIVDGARIVADTEPVLVMSATGDAALMSEVATHFAGLGVRRLIATQVDISRRLGTVLTAADTSRLSLAQISVTPYLARGLSPMHPHVCARLILAPLDARATASSDRK
tara:strand:- start:6376 stop:7500 length:1125 start_codon:yes stop_codon:yes gene_type:complete